MNLNLSDKMDTFPYKSTFVSSHPGELLYNLKYDPELMSVVSNSISEYPSEMIGEDGCYERANILTDLYTEKARVKARVNGLLSPLEYWQTNEEKIRQEAKERFGEVSNFTLREVIYLTCKEATAFSPVLSKYIYDCLLSRSNSKVLDPFSGWGDRAIGALASDKVGMYEGVDCNPGVFPGYQKLIQDLDSSGQSERWSLPLKGKKLTFHQSTFENFKGKERYYDLIFSSPPFFDYEIYHSDSSQSINGRSRYLDWFRNWMTPVLRQMVKYIRKGGLIALHIGETYRAPHLPRDVKKVLTEQCHLKFIQTINCSVRGKRPIPIWVYRY